MEYLNVVKKSPLFMGIAEDEINSLLKCLSAKEVKYSKNEFICRVGDSVSSLGIMLNGNAHIVKEDFWGNRTIISQLETGDLFAEVFACVKNTLLPFSVMSLQDTTVLYLDCKNIMTMCTTSCGFHNILVRNLITILANKNILLTQKLEHMSKRTTREKLMSYLSAQAVLRGKNSFDIPFNRQELADYLSVDRSAMSNELSKMRDEGILDFERNHFKMKETY